MSNFSLASNGVSSEKLVKFKPKSGDAVAIPLEDARLSSVIESMMSDLNDEAVLTGEIPLPDVDRDALVAIAKSLAQLRVMKEGGQSYTYKPLRELIEKNLPALDEKSLHEFLKAALFLDLSMLYKPAVAIWVDLLIGKKPVTMREIIRAEVLLEKNLDRLKENRLLAPDLEPLFHGYFGHFKNLVPTQQKTIKLPSNDTMMDIIQVGAKLYFITFSSDTVTPIDAATLELEKPIAVGQKPRALVAVGNKIYVANSGDNTISIIDATTDTIIGQIQCGPPRRPYGGLSQLAIVGNKLYAWEKFYGILFAIDLRSEQVVGELKLKRAIDIVSEIKAVDDVLYILTWKNIVMLDTKTDKVSAPLLTDKAVKSWKHDDFPKTFIISSDKVYALDKGKRIYIIDFKTKEEIKSITGISDVASLGSLVFVGSQSSKNISIWNSASKGGDEMVGSIGIPYSRPKIFIAGDAIYVWSYDKSEELTQIKIDSYYLVD
jgi:YVTN family beta-propeller protein